MRDLAILATTNDSQMVMCRKADHPPAK